MCRAMAQQLIFEQDLEPFSLPLCLGTQQSHLISRRWPVCSPLQTQSFIDNKVSFSLLHLLMYGNISNERPRFIHKYLIVKQGQGAAMEIGRREETKVQEGDSEELAQVWSAASVG